jgi:hypothetical protein
MTTDIVSLAPGLDGIGFRIEIGLKGLQKPPLNIFRGTPIP